MKNTQKKIEFRNKDKKVKRIKKIQAKNASQKEPQKTKISLPKSQKINVQPKKEKSKSDNISVNTNQNFKPENLKKSIEKQVQSAIAYVYKITDMYTLEIVAGEPLDDLTQEKYLSFGETIIFCNPCGIYDDAKYLNRLVTRFRHGNETYMLVVSSFAFEGLTRKSNYKKVFKIIENGGFIL